MKNLSLSQKALLAVFIILLPITLTFVYGYRKNKEQLKGAVLKEMTVIAEAYEGQVLQHLDVVKRRVAGLSADKSIKAFAREAVAGKKGSAGRLASYFISENAEYGIGIKTISLISPVGRVLASTDPSRVGQDRALNESFLRGSSNTSIAEEKNIGSGIPEIAISAPVLDGASGGLLGVITATVPFSDLNRLLSGESNKELGALSWSKGRHETMEVYLVNRDRVMLTDSIFIKDAAMRQKAATDPVGKCLEAGIEMTGFYKDYRGIEVAGASMCFPGVGWTLLVETDESEVVRPAEEMLKSAVIGAAMAGILIIAFYILIIRKMVKRVGRLAKAAGEIASGNYDVALQVKSLDEIGELNMAFNTMARDIRERNAEILMEKDRARMYLDLAGVVIVAIGLDEKVRLINRKGCDLLGLRAEYIIGLNWFESFVPEHSREEMRECFRRYLKGEEKTDYYEKDIVTAEGGVRTVAWHNTVLRDLSGAVIGTLSSGEDVTDKRRAEEALRISERKYRTILDESRDVIFVATPDLRLMDLNPVAEEVFGYRLTELVGKRLEGLFIEESDRERFKGAIRERGEVKGFDARVRKKDAQEIWLSISARRVEETGGPICRGIMRDITMHKHLEAQLLQAQKMEAVGQLTGGIAHDFNNILTAIMSSAGLLELMLPGESKQMHYVRQIVSSAERASNLTRGLLAFSRKTLVELKPVRVNEIIRNTERLLSRLIGEDIDFKVSLTDADPVVTADVSQIEQVLMNLATNARDAMPSGGALSISTGTISLAHESMKEQAYMRPGEYALITVSDTGTGMERRVVERIFDPFFTTKEVGKGTGLGLAIAYGIMKQHNGYINVYSEPGVGTQFKLYLPLAGIKAEEEDKIRSEAPQGGTETILLAEDDAEVRNLIKALLEEFGYTVIEAGNGEEAVRKYAELGKDVDLLVLDV
ncbi:MAG: PAS domain S-box protein, partial [Deltaproteobacteria bacterium]|nr:PAS domain S-box protein [Deltaproteobacteria bacterium]